MSLFPKNVDLGTVPLAEVSFCISPFCVCSFSKTIAISSVLCNRVKKILVKDALSKRRLTRAGEGAVGLFIYLLQV